MSILDTIYKDITQVVSGVEKYVAGIGQQVAADLKYIIGNTGRNLTEDINNWAGKYIQSLGAPSAVALGMVAFVGDIVEVVDTEGQDEAAAQDIVKKIANAPEFIQKIAAVSTKMAQNVVAEAGATGGSPGLLGWKGWATIITVIHMILMVGFIGISGIRTFVSDPAFLGQRWNAAAREIGLNFLAFYKAPTFVAIGALTATDTQALFNYFDQSKPQTIINDNKGGSGIWNAQDFMDELRYIYTNQLGKSRSVSKKDLTALVKAKITFGAAGAPQNTTAPAVSGGSPIAPTKIYSGIIAQGVLQPAESYTPQPKEIIKDSNELTAVVHDNLAGYLAALPGKIHYEITIVPRVVLPDGSVAVAGVQRIIKGYTKAGKAEYKNVLNKYAKLSIYLIENNGRRVKIDEIVLGSTDATNFQPSIQDLAALAGSVKANITTQNPTDIMSVATPGGGNTVTISTSPVVVPNPAQAAIDLAASKGRPAQVTASTTYAEALQNLIPMRFQTIPTPNGFPQTILYVGETPNILYNGTELTLQQAQDLIKSFPRDHLVDLDGNNLVTGQPNQYQKPGSVEFLPGQWLKLASLGSFKGTFDNVLSGQLPQSQFVWAYKTKSGEVQTFVPLSKIPTTP